MTFRPRFCLLTGGLLASLGSAAAQVSIWTGIGGNSNWTTPVNWSGGNAPANDGTASIRFGEAGQREVIVNLSQSVKGLLFDFVENPSLNYLLSGSSANLTIGSDGIRIISPSFDESSGNLISDLPPSAVKLLGSVGVVLSANQAWSTSTGSFLQVDSTISGSGQLTFTGDGYIGL